VVARNKETLRLRRICTFKHVLWVTFYGMAGEGARHGSTAYAGWVETRCWWLSKLGHKSTRGKLHTEMRILETSHVGTWRLRR